MSSDVPLTKDLINPVLAALHDLGGTAKNTAIYEAVTSQLRLKDIPKLHHKGGDRDALAYRLAWAKTQLRAHGLISNPQPSIWALTEKGRLQREVYTDIINKPINGGKQINVRLPPQTFEMVTDICALLEVSRAQFVNDLIHAFKRDSEIKDVKT